MKKIIFIALVALTSCNASKFCADRFPPDTLVHTEYRTVTEYRDTIVPIYIPGDTVYEVREITDTAYAETEYACAAAWVVADLLQLSLVQKDYEREVLLEEVLVHKTDTVEVIKEIITRIPEDKPVTKYAAFWVVLGMFWLFVLFAVLGLARGAANRR